MSQPEHVVIGAGAGGAAVAWRLTQRGHRVLLIDAGPRFGVQDYALLKDDWERTQFPEKPGSQGRYSYAPMQVLDERWAHLRSWSKTRGRFHNEATRQVMPGGGYQHVRGIGGSTLHFTGEAHRLNPHSMRMASEHAVAADWPLSYAELEPYYTLAEQCVGVAGPTETGDRWRSAAFPLLPHPFSPAARALAEAGASLGMHWVANARAALSQVYDGRPFCNYCGNCNRGCTRRDKGSADIAFVEKAEASGRCTVLSRHQALRLNRDKAGRIESVVCVDASGQRHVISGKYFYLCAGAIETPRLLLASVSAQAPQGIGNQHALVGKHLMDTQVWVSVGLQAKPLDSHKGLPADAICWDFNRPDAIAGVVGGCRFTHATHEANLTGLLNYALRVAPGWGLAHKQAVRSTFGRALAVSGIGESLPNSGSYVDLDPQQKDAHGMPLARIHSFVDEQAVRRLDFMARKCRAILQAAGCQDIIEESGSYDQFAMTHVFGTCRMGGDPQSSVVDADCRVYGSANLRICDASIFPSSGGGESPSLTIQALALRAVDRLLGRPA